MHISDDFLKVKFEIKAVTSWKVAQPFSAPLIESKWNLNPFFSLPPVLYTAFLILYFKNCYKPYFWKEKLLRSQSSRLLDNIPVDRSSIVPHRSCWPCTQKVTKRCRPSWLTNSALVHLSPNAGGGELRGLSQWVQLCTGSSNKSNFIFNLWFHSISYIYTIFGESILLLSPSPFLIN
jgi:hypothetical protein